MGEKNTKIKKISILTETIEKQNAEEKFFFYMAHWFLSEIKILKSLYVLSMNVKATEGVELYGRNCRTILLGNILASKLWEGWQIV